MTLHDLLKSLFGFPSSSDDHHSNASFPEHEESCDCFDNSTDNYNNNGKEESWSFSFGNIDDMFRHFHGDMRQQMDEMHTQMEEVFKNFGANDFPILSNIEGDHENDGETNQNKNLREGMLKQPGTDTGNHGDGSNRERFGFNFPRRFGGFSTPDTPKQKEDSDVTEVGTDDIAQLYKKQTDDTHELTRPHTQYRQVSVRVMRKPDGSVHEERTVCDGNGNCETTTTTRSTQGDDVISGMPPSLPSPSHDHNSHDSQPGIMDKFLWPWQKENKGKQLRDSPEMTDASIYDNIFGKK